MAKVDFSAILGASVGSAPQPKPLPEGTYSGVIDGVPKTQARNTKEGQKGVVTITIALQEAADDVDAEALAESGGLIRNDGRPRMVSTDFWLTEDAMYRFDNFLQGFGYNADSGKSYQEAMEELDGREVTLSVKQREYQRKDGSTAIAVDIDRCFAKAA